MTPSVRSTGGGEPGDIAHYPLPFVKIERVFGPEVRG